MFLHARTPGSCRRFLAVWISAGLLMTANTAIAAKFEVLCPGSGEPNVGCSISLKGKIEQGDAERLVNILRSTPNSSDIYRELILNSPGGDVLEALRLAEVVRKALLETRNSRFSDFMGVTKNITAGQMSKRDRDKLKKAMADVVFPCVSACFLVFMSGAKRSYLAFGDGRIGLHRPFLTSNSYSQLDAAAIAARQGDATQQVAGFLSREGVPARFIDEMMRRSSKEVYWLSAADWNEFPGTAFWYEELLIARCNVDPTTEAQITQALTRNDWNTAEALKPKLMQEASCERSVIRDAQTRMRVGL
jgi:hypothetical protein